MVWLITWAAPGALPRRGRGHAQPFPALLPVPPAPSPLAQPWIIPQLSGQTPSEGLEGRVRQEPVLKSGSILPQHNKNPSEPLPAFLRHGSGQNRMENGAGFLHEPRVSDTRSHTARPSPVPAQAAAAAGAAPGVRRERITGSCQEHMAGSTRGQGLSTGWKSAQKPFTVQLECNE